MPRMVRLGALESLSEQQFVPSRGRTHALPQMEWGLVAPEQRRVIKNLQECIDKAPKLMVLNHDAGFAYGGRRTMPDNGGYYWRVTQLLWPTYAFIPAFSWPMGFICDRTRER